MSSDQRKNMSRNGSANATKYSQRSDPGEGYMRDERPRRDRDDDSMDNAGSSGLQRVKKGSRNWGYHEEVRELQCRGNFRSQDSWEEEYRRNFPPRREGSREPYGRRSRIYEVADDEERNYSEPNYNDDSTMDTENMRNNKTRFSINQKAKQNGNVEADYPDDVSLDIDQENRGYSETRFYNDQNIVETGRTEPGNMAIGYTDRGYAPPNYNGYPALVPMMIDRSADVSMENIQYQQAGTTWNTQVPFTMQTYPTAPRPKTEEEEEKKPRKVWWYTTCRVFSAILIICNLVSDWLQESDMDDPIGDIKSMTKLPLSTVYCNVTVGGKQEKAAEQFLYLTIAGTVFAVGQLVNIIYQIVQNHRLKADDKIPEYVDERTEVFLVNIFIEFPQNYLICRWEKSVPEACMECGITLNSKKMKRFMNGFVSLASSFWRYFTHIKISSGGSKCSCSSLCEKCAERLGNCIKGCLLGCLKCLCPCCFCCMDCKICLPCCCSYIVCKNCKCSVESMCKKPKCGACAGGTSFLAELATIPTGLVTFLYIYRVLRYFCGLKMTYFIFDFIIDKIIGKVWDSVMDSIS